MNKTTKKQLTLLSELVNYFGHRDFYDDFKTSRCPEMRELEAICNRLGLQHDDYGKLKKEVKRLKKTG